MINPPLCYPWHLCLLSKGSEGLASGLSLCSWILGGFLCDIRCSVSLGGWSLGNGASMRHHHKNGRTDIRDLPTLIVCAGNNGAGSSHRIQSFSKSCPRHLEWMAWSLGNDSKVCLTILDEATSLAWLLNLCESWLQSCSYRESRLLGPCPLWTGSNMLRVSLYVLALGKPFWVTSSPITVGHLAAKGHSRKIYQ